MGELGILAANRLTANWAQSAVADGRSTVLSGAGAWPLLALLAAAAGGPARTELQAATGIPADGAEHEAAELLAAIAGSRAARAALGLWARAELPFTDWWRGAVPPGVRGALTGDPSADQGALDAWARKQTADLIDRMPVRVSADTLLVLATALSVQTDWAEQFTDSPMMIMDGPWAAGGPRPVGDPLPYGPNWHSLPRVAGLLRDTRDIDALSVAQTEAGKLTTLAVRGRSDVDVHLVLGGPHRRAADILAAGVLALAGPRSTGTQLPLGTPGPGVRVEEVPSTDPAPTLSVATVRFRVDAAHDLLADPDLFGLRTAMDDSRGHFPGISPEPLAVSQAQQAAMAQFTAEGFRAAAVTAAAVSAGAAAPRASTVSRLISVTFDRPFGFLAVHRPTGLVLVAGWVGEPEPAA